MCIAWKHKQRFNGEKVFQLFFPSVSLLFFPTPFIYAKVKPFSLFFCSVRLESKVNTKENCATYQAAYFRRVCASVCITKKRWFSRFDWRAPVAGQWRKTWNLIPFSFHFCWDYSGFCLRCFTAGAGRLDEGVSPVDVRQLVFRDFGFSIPLVKGPGIDLTLTPAKILEIGFGSTATNLYWAPASAPPKNSW